MKIDLHVHTRERSTCALSSTDEMICAAIDAGLDGLVITDHDCLVSSDRLDYLNGKYAPFRIFGGVEVTTHGEHILVLGVNHDRLEDGWWSYRELHDFVVDRSGLLALAHPYRFNPDRIEADIDEHPPHALEAYSCNTPASAASRIRAVAAELEVPLLSNSDAHRAAEIGDYYNVLDEEPEGIEELVKMLKEGRFEVVAPQS